MKLQISSRIAIYAVLELAAHGDKPLAASDIADAYGISTHHLSKVLHTIARAGLVKSVRGAGGGYVFAANPRRVTLGEIVALFEPIRSGSLEPGMPGGETPVGAALGTVLDEIDEIAEATLQSITVSTMLKRVAAAGDKRRRPATVSAG